MVALLHRKTDGAGEQKCEGALGISRCPTRLNDGHRACRLTFWSMTLHILIQPVSPSHRESQGIVAERAGEPGGGAYIGQDFDGCEHTWAVL